MRLRNLKIYPAATTSALTLTLDLIPEGKSEEVRKAVAIAMHRIIEDYGV